MSPRFEPRETVIPVSNGSGYGKHRPHAWDIRTCEQVKRDFGGGIEGGIILSDTTHRQLAATVTLGYGW
jgi:hypothetical protein